MKMKLKRKKIARKRFGKIKKRNGLMISLMIQSKLQNPELNWSLFMVMISVMKKGLQGQEGAEDMGKYLQYAIVNYCINLLPHFL